MEQAVKAPVRWPETVDELIGADQVLAFAYVTPAEGVVILPLTNLALRDRQAGRMTPVSSSIGMWRKLARIKEEPRVAVAYHAREHGFSKRPEYVLVQGLASLTPPEERDWIDRHLESWERFSGPRDVGPIGERWLRAYHWRVGVELDVERLASWPDLNCHGTAELLGLPLPSVSPPPQRPPARGTAPRISVARAVKRAQRLPHVLLGWVGVDGYPVVVPVKVIGAERDGVALQLPEGIDSPAGGRRAGLLAHSFARYTFGQHQRKFTGWLKAEADSGRAVYAPHTESGYHLPPSKLLYRTASGFVTNRGLREARRAGFLAA